MPDHGFRLRKRGGATSLQCTSMRAHEAHPYTNGWRCPGVVARYIRTWCCPVCVPSAPDVVTYSVFYDSYSEDAIFESLIEAHELEVHGIPSRSVWATNA